MNRQVRRLVAAAATALLAVAVLPVLPAASASAAAGPVGAGFTVTPSDLAFILKQIKIAEAHAATATPTNPCGTLVGPGPNQIPDTLTPWGLRTVDGSCNNLTPGRETFAAADLTFPRLTTPVFKPAEFAPSAFGGTDSVSSYAQTSGTVVDSQPRMISNLVVDQTSTNPAAVAVANQTHPGHGPCTSPGVPAGCTPDHTTLFIPNITPDAGLSPPYNSLFTFFGQFFDHGLDQTVKGGNGIVFVPLKDDDPLVAGPDHQFGTADDLPASKRFMLLTRATDQRLPDGTVVHEARNTDTPWVDQSQTYASHASHQVFLREYALVGGRPVSTGRLLGGTAGTPGASGLATWTSVKAQAADVLGLRLTDADAVNVPMIATDPYGKFIPGKLRGMPQYVTAGGVLVEGDLANPVPVPADVVHFDTPFLTDIAHNADPFAHNPDGSTTPLAPDADTVANDPNAPLASGTYDDELLGLHFIAGDGRANENIALSAIHQVFHSEHNRLVADIENVLTNDTSTTGVAALAEWKSATGAGGWNGERLFQAARFINEMEYQHGVFEEFARKVQPALPAFRAYNPDLRPAISEEFAQGVYRFGHSMLDDTVARTNADGSDNSLPLLTAFLNPAAYYQNGAGTYTPEQAAGAIIMGSSDQVGNEMDEFMTETLRNNLLGLPLDLATLNITRARETGIPSLNAVRRQLFAATNDGQLTPYTSWADLGQHLRHPESLVNLVAAYGTHPSIVSATTVAAKRAAAQAIVNPPTGVTPPADATDFVNGTGAWANSADGVTTTGVDDVDLWLGGLAEKTTPFGGLLGSTFNYVFENQLQQLQDGDRLYYLNRLAGLNLRQSIEGNSFAELFTRNTDGTNTLKADAFGTADCKFQLANLNGTPAGYAQYGATVADDLTTPCREDLLLLRKPDGTIQYNQNNTVDKNGINGQSVFNGGGTGDRVWGGNDNDTFWGGTGNDVIQGDGGDDVALGGEGDDIITDSSGLDILKGGPGNDAVDGGAGNDILVGGDGQDVLNGGGNDNEEFGGTGSDFVIAGTGSDTAAGGNGDDWIQGGTGVDLLQGDNGAPFLDDAANATPGNDVLVGQSGDNTYTAEGGDDIMAGTTSVDRFAGLGGFDWATHQYDTSGVSDDMNLNTIGAGAGAIVANKDSWQETEAVSGSPYNDTLRGDDVTPSAQTGAGIAGCDVLDQAGIDRIAGLSAIIPAPTLDPAAVVAGSAAKYCPTTGPVWGDGNVLLGGAGSDILEGRGGNDILDGDRALTVRISVRTDPADPATEIGSTDLLEHTYQTNNPATLQADIFAGKVNPRQLVIVRSVAPAGASGDTDTAVFTGPMSNYSITSANGATIVTQTGPNVTGQKVSDGTDTLRGIEQIQFSDKVFKLVLPDAPTLTGAVASTTGSPGKIDVTWTPAATATTGTPVTSYDIVATPAGGGTPVVRSGIAAPATSGTVNNLVVGTTYSVTVRAVNAAGAGPASNAISATPTVPTVPGAPTIGTAKDARSTTSSGALTVDFQPPTSTGSSAITGYDAVATPTSGTAPAVTVTGIAGSPATVSGLVTGVEYTVKVRATNAAGSGAWSSASNPATPTGTPPAPTGVTGQAANASVGLAWQAPTTNGGSTISAYEVQALAGATVAKTVTVAGSQTTTVVTGLTNGTAYTFTVRAQNATGWSPLSAASAPVTPATTPGAPTIGKPQSGSTKDSVITATATWTAPASNGGSAITGYKVTAYQIGSKGTVIGTPLTKTAPAGATSYTFSLTTGNWSFTVLATNAMGDGPSSAMSSTAAAK